MGRSKKYVLNLKIRDKDMLIRELFDPSSGVYGFITVIASMGTIFALFLTIHSLKQTREQNDLISKKHTLDILFKNLEKELEKVIFLRDWANGAEIHFGRFAIYLAGVNNNQILFQYNNLANIKNYLDIFHMYLNSIPIVLSRINHSITKNIYQRKLDAEIKFVKEYIRPQLEVYGKIDERRASRVRELLELIDELP